MSVLNSSYYVYFESFTVVKQRILEKTKCKLLSYLSQVLFHLVRIPLVYQE